jgi:hypothetical protein
MDMTGIALGSPVSILKSIGPAKDTVGGCNIVTGYVSGTSNRRTILIRNCYETKPD